MAFEFDRYINGQLMAEGVTIERQGNLPDAMREAARIASRGPNGEVPVLVLRAEALSRTGAVKVKALEWEERKTRLGTVWWSAPNPLGGLSIEAASENDKIAAQADFEHRILSALEPASPERVPALTQVGWAYQDKKWDADRWHVCGQEKPREHEGRRVEPIYIVEPAASEGRQEAVAWRFRWPKNDGSLESWTYTDDKEHAVSLAADDGEVEPLYTRPSEQAVTEAMERFERIADIIERNLWRQDEKVEDAKQIAIQGAVALKAAMEAGR